VFIVWLIVTSVVRKLAGMSTGLSRNLGDPLRSSSWGSASINAAGFRGCIRVQEYTTGFILRTMWLLGNGEVWLPRSDLYMGDTEPGGWLRSRSRSLSCGGYEIKLYGRLADFMESKEDLRMTTSG
jgi:hypothetical protein